MNKHIQPSTPSNSGKATRGRRLMLQTGLALAATISMGTSTSWAQTGNTFKIAIMSDMSGPVKDLSGPGSVAAAQLAIEDFGGKVLGRPIELLQGDTMNKVDVGITLARQWYDNGVGAVFDIGVSPLAIATQDLAREKNKIAIFTSSASAELTTKYCSPNGIQWIYNSYPTSKGDITAAMKEVGKSWYFITVDYSFGKTMEADARGMVEKAGGKVLGSNSHAFSATDFSSQLLQAQQSKAEVIGLATVTSSAGAMIKQAKEFGITAKLVPLSFMFYDIKALGLEAAQGLYSAEAYYWDMNDESRNFAKRLAPRFNGRMPNMVNAGTYGAVMHYLKAVAAVGKDDTAAILAKMKSTPINDFMTKNGHIREDGQVLRDFHIFQVKKPSESKGEYDLYKYVGTVPAAEAFRPADKSLCSLVK